MSAVRVHLSPTRELSRYKEYDSTQFFRFDSSIYGLSFMDGDKILPDICESPKGKGKRLPMFVSFSLAYFLILSKNLRSAYTWEGELLYTVTFSGRD
ncbi:hypothetical protein Ddye_023308 [Dipteronia dyeriana]|uniref:Uncharacterized protein n=1 Tax=Dipteronia dyeriana TaxID=168575 RepID=A0AAD9TTP4_9ROSI|nr:hypothetical protein Ddye_023308 [Dipteronia dyeriana]